VQTPYGQFELFTYSDKSSSHTHLALVKGDIQPQKETLVRVHEPLSVMDFLEQASYPNSTSVHDAMLKMSQSPAGVLVLMHPAETSASLLARASAKTEAHHAQWDPRSYGIGAQILRDLNVGKMRLLATPRKLPSMTGFGLEIVGYTQIKG
jgi:3,4-dihydroxy 2-butanone 4-phosphate synthase/GTP cyclohydrolase II